MLNTAEKLERARFAVLRDQPFFGSILLHYYNAFVASFETETLATNARQITYNPTWVAKVFEPHLQAYLAKIALHIACEHPLRLGNRDVGLANLAMALAVNPMLRDAGFDLPPDAPLDPQFDNMAWEQIYDILAQQQKPGTDVHLSRPCLCARHILVSVVLPGADGACGRAPRQTLGGGIMKPTSNLAALIERYFTERLMRHRNVSPNTIASCRDTFRLLFSFARLRLHKPPSDLAINDLDAPFICAFLDDLDPPLLH